MDVRTGLAVELVIKMVIGLVVLLVVIGFVTKVIEGGACAPGLPNCGEIKCDSSTEVVEGTFSSAEVARFASTCLAQGRACESNFVCYTLIGEVDGSVEGVKGYFSSSEVGYINVERVPKDTVVIDYQYLLDEVTIR